MKCPDCGQEFRIIRCTPEWYKIVAARGYYFCPNCGAHVSVLEAPMSGLDGWVCACGTDNRIQYPLLTDAKTMPVECSKCHKPHSLIVVGGKVTQVLGL